jgi:hypothetical protein
VLNAAASLGTLGAVDSGLAATDYTAPDETRDTSGSGLNSSPADVPGCQSALTAYTNDEGKIDVGGLRDAMGDWKNADIDSTALQSAIQYLRSQDVVVRAGSIALSFEGGSGPFVADGSDTATVTAEVTDEAGDPLSDVSVGATLFERRDNRRPLSVQDNGDGSFTIEVQSIIASKAQLRVHSGDLCEQESMQIEFEPGSAASFSVDDVNRTPPGETTAQESHLTKRISPTTIDTASSHREHPIKGSFAVTVRDSQSNLLPVSEGDIQVGSSETVHSSVDGNVVNVTGELSDPFTSTEQNNFERWGTMDVTVEAPDIPRESTQVQLEFPFVTVEQHARKIDGEYKNVLRCNAVNYTVMTNYNFFLPIPDEFISDVKNPGSDNGFSEPTVQSDGSGNGVYIYSEQARDAEDGEKNTVEPFVDIILSNPLEIPGKEGFAPTDIDFYGLEFEGLPEIPTFTETYKIKYVDIKTLCITIWKGPNTDQDRIDKSKQQIFDVFDKSMPNCCPLVFIEFNEREISQDEWDDIDTDGDGLDQFDDKKEVEDEDGNKIKKPKLKDEESDLFEDFHDDDCLNAYFVPDIENDLWGRAYPEVSDSGSDVHFDTNGEMDGDSVVINNSEPDADDWDYKTLAHELGHIVGELKDYDNPANAPGGKDNLQTDPLKPGTGGFWSEAQCSKINELCGDN